MMVETQVVVKGTTVRKFDIKTIQERGLLHYILHKASHCEIALTSKTTVARSFTSFRRYRNSTV